MTWYDLYWYMQKPPLDKEVKMSIEGGTFIKDFKSLCQKISNAGLKGFSDRVVEVSIGVLKQRGIVPPKGASKTQIVAVAYENRLLFEVQDLIVGYVSAYLSQEITPYSMPTVPWLEIFCRTFDLKKGSNLWENFKNMQELVGKDNLEVLQHDAEEMMYYF